MSTGPFEQANACQISNVYRVRPRLGEHYFRGIFVQGEHFLGNKYSISIGSHPDKGNFHWRGTLSMEQTPFCLSRYYCNGLGIRWWANSPNTRKKIVQCQAIMDGWKQAVFWIRPRRLTVGVKWRRSVIAKMASKFRLALIRGRLMRERAWVETSVTDLLFLKWYNLNLHNAWVLRLAESSEISSFSWEDAFGLWMLQKFLEHQRKGN